MVVTVRATSDGVGTEDGVAASTDALITIYLVNVDEIPSFDMPLADREKLLAEATPVGDEVLQLTATDPDNEHDTILGSPTVDQDIIYALDVGGTNELPNSGVGFFEVSEAG